MRGNTTGFRPWVIALCLALASHGVASQAEEPYFDIRFVRSSLAAARVTAAQLDYGLCTSGKPPIPLSEISILESHEALLAGKLNCSQLVTGLLRRIDAYDKPLDLSAIMRLHPDALPNAAAKDEELKRIRQAEIGDALPPLFCIPILLKDNIDAAGLPTTAGSPALANNRPEGDSHVVAKLKAAGAIILGKSSMGELAFFPAWCTSSLSGSVRNPYHLMHTPGGSSGGCAAAVASGFAIAALGTDTGNSVRGPASHAALVGLRPSLGLVGRSGILPLRWERDTIGPLTRTVTDAAIMLGVMAGPDPNDNLTFPLSSAQTPPPVAEDYTVHLDSEGLRGARIGVYSSIASIPQTNNEIFRLFVEALGDMSSAGATMLQNFRIIGNSLGSEWDANRRGQGPALGHWNVGGPSGQWLDLWSCRSPLREGFDQYVTAAKAAQAARPVEMRGTGGGTVNGTDARQLQRPDPGEDGHAVVGSLEELFQSRQFHPLAENDLRAAVLGRGGGQEGRVNGTGEVITCGCGTIQEDPCRLEFQKRLVESMDAANVDVIVYPTWGRPPLLLGDMGDGYFDGNNSPMIAPHTGAPAITVPMGYSGGGLPAGIQFLARPFDEARLLKIAYAYEQMSKHRRSPPLFTECVDPSPSNNIGSTPSAWAG